MAGETGVWACGWNRHGALGLGDKVYSVADFTAVPGLPPGLHALACGP